MRRALLPATLVALLLVVLLLVASALAPPIGTPAAGGPVRVEQVDTASYPEITLYVSARDAAGNPRADLSAADFAVTEDGVPVELSDFGGLGGEPVSSVLVVDRSGSMDEDDKIEGARDAAGAFVDLMRPGDRAALIAFNHEARVAQGFTADQGELRDAIERLEAEDGTALYDAVVAGVELLRDEPGRRLLLVLSDGQDCSVPSDSCPDEYGSSNTLQEAIAYAEAAGQPVAVVGLGDRAGAGDEGIDEAVLQQIAEATGGRYFYAPEAGELAVLYAGLAADVQQEYRLTYVSPRPSYDGTRRDIAVSVGGAAAAGGYTERHLINVVSSPLAGVVLLVPLAGLLLLPGLLRRSAGRAPAPVVGSYQPEAAVPALVVPAPAAAAPAPPTIVAGTRRGRRGDTPLRATARFCSRCGAAQGE
jgi:Ca-activated chloride channel homolog